MRARASSPSYEKMFNHHIVHEWKKSCSVKRAMIASDTACACSRTANKLQHSLAERPMYAMIPEGHRACRGFAAAVADLLNLNRPQRRRRPARRKRRGCLVGEMASWVWSHVADEMETLRYALATTTEKQVSAIAIQQGEVGCMWRSQ